MRLSTLVPVGSFLVAIVIASLTPSTRGLLRAAGETTGCKPVGKLTARSGNKRFWRFGRRLRFDEFCQQTPVIS